MERIACALNDWEVARWLSRVPHPYQYTDAAEFLEECRITRHKGTAFRFIIDHENQIVGGIGLEKRTESYFELGYWVARESWGKGIATESVLSIIKFSFIELEAVGIFASCHEKNHSSENVLLKAKFNRIGLGQQYSRSLDKQVTTIEFFRDRSR